MKKIFLFMLGAMLALCACDKKKLAPESGISATIDGVAENFNTIDSAAYHHTDTSYSMSITASNGASASADKIELYVNSRNPITTTTYSLTPGSYNPPYVPLIVYFTNGGNNFADDYVIDYTGQHQISITITSISSTNAQGTFEGTLVVAAGSSGATKTITDGKFNIAIK